MAPLLGVYQPAMCCLMLYVVLQVRLDLPVGVVDAEAAEMPQQENADIARGGGELTIWDVGQLAKKEESQQKNDNNLRGGKKWAEVVAQLTGEGPKPNDEGKSDVPRQPLQVPDFVKAGDHDDELWGNVHSGFDPVNDGLTKDETDLLRNWRHYGAQKRHSMFQTIGWGVGDLVMFGLFGPQSIAPWVLLAAPVAAGLAWYIRYRQQKSAKEKLLHLVTTRIRDVGQRRWAGLAVPNWSLNE